MATRTELERLGDEVFCYVTTTGRRSGRSHTIEIWFAAHNGTAYILMGSGQRADTVRNLRADPSVGLRIGNRTWDAEARVVTDTEEAVLARRLLADKYASHEDGLEAWAEEALPVAIEVVEGRSRATRRPTVH